MAITGADADAMVAASKRNCKELSVDYQIRFMEDELLLCREVVGGKLGEVYYAEATTLDHLIGRGGFNNGGHWDIDSEVEDSAFGTVTLASGDTDHVVLSEEAAHVIKVLVAIYISARTGKPYHTGQ